MYWNLIRPFEPDLKDLMKEMIVIVIVIVICCGLLYQVRLGASLMWWSSKINLAASQTSLTSSRTGWTHGSSWLTS